MKADAESNVKTAQYLLNRISKFYFNQPKMGVANLKMSENMRVMPIRSLYNSDFTFDQAMRIF